MVRAGLTLLSRLRVTLVYGAMLFIVTTALSMMDPSAEERVVEKASTNLHNLAHGHVGTLVGSAFVVDAGAVVLWLPALLCLLALGELTWGSGRLVVAFTAGHIGATLLVAAGLAAAVKGGWTGAEITRATDVGMSYGATAVLGALTPAIPPRWRGLWIGWWLGVDAAVVATGGDFTDAGHGLALILGMLVATRFGRPAAWTRGRLLLLAVATWFGFLLLASASDELVVPAGCGLVAALTGGLVTRLAADADAVPRRGGVSRIA